MTLQYIALVVKGGLKVVKLDRTTVDKETMLWKDAMIMYVVVDSPTIGVVTIFLGQWKFQVKSLIYHHNK